MGLFRVAASIGTLGAVSPHSRQSRDTRAIMREAKKQTELLAQIATQGEPPQEPSLTPVKPQESNNGVLAFFVILAVFGLIFLLAAL